MSRWAITLDGVDVTAYVVTEDLPEWVETTVKGAGFFDWEVKPFSFRLHQNCPQQPRYGQPAAVAINGVERFSGVVDGIREAFSKTPELTVAPPAVTLKDVMAGFPGVDPQTNAERFLFEIPADAPLGIQDAILLALSRYNENKDDRLAAISEWTVDVQGSAEDWLGLRFPHGLTGPEDGSAPANTFFADTEWRIRFPRMTLPDENGETFWVDGANRRLIFYEGGPQMPSLNLRVFRRVDDGALFLAQWQPLTRAVDTATVTLEPDQYWRLAPLGANGEADNAAPWGPLVTANYQDEYVPDGYTMPGADSSYIEPATAVAYVRGYLGINEDEFLVCHASQDTAAGTWAMVIRWVPIPAPHEIETRLYVVWYGNPLTQTVSGVWHNQPMIDLVKLFAMVSGRWLKVEGTHITLAPRLGDVGAVDLPDLSLAIEKDQWREYQNPAGELAIEVIDRDTEGSTGLDFTAGRVSALSFAYLDLLSGEVIGTEGVWPVGLEPEGLQLLAGSQHGQVNGISWAMDGRRFRVETMQEGQ